MNVVLVMFRDGERREFPLEEEETVIGRRQDCGLRVPTADVSRRHCIIDTAGRQPEVQDLESANGTFVNGKRVENATLNPGDRLKVGPAVFVVQIDGEPAEISEEDIQSDLVESEESDSPTTATVASPPKPEPKPKSAPKQPAQDDDDDDDVIMDLSEEDLFEVDDDDDDDPISAMEAILDDEDEDEDEDTKKQ